MNTNNYQLSVGDFKCLFVHDGQHSYSNPAGLLFPDAPADLLREELLGCGILLEEWESWTSDYTCVLVDTGTHRVLMDTGAGSFLPEAGQFIKNMRMVGFELADIDIVLLSHAHPDHIGAVDFPNARIVMSRKEWQFWRSKPELPRLPLAMREMLLQMISPVLSSLEDRIELIDGDTEIVPGVKMFEAPGHTPGHMATSISSCGQELLYVGDALLHPLHVKNPQWNALVDVCPDKAEATRKRLLAHAVDNHATLFGFHFSSLVPWTALQHLDR
jgi:glyoxylase-like metal-dependent hydrolase (beta-lactamase superfamily II)